MKTYTIPAAVLGALGGLQRQDAPVVRIDPQIGIRYSWHPLLDTEDKPAPDDCIILPASSAAVAAVLARSVGLYQLQGFGFTMTSHPRTAVVPEVWRLRGPRASIYFASTECFYNGVPCNVVPGIHAAKDAHHALGIAACWVARVRRADAAGYPLAALAPGADHALLLSAAEKSRGWDAWEVTS